MAELTAAAQYRIWRKEIERKTESLPGSYKRDILSIFDEMSHQWKEANHSARALEKIIKDKIGDITMTDYLMAMDATAIMGTDYSDPSKSVNLDELESDI